MFHATPAPEAPALAPVAVVAQSNFAFGPAPERTRTRLRVHRENSDVLVGESATIGGTLAAPRPGLTRGRQVALQVLRRGGWETVARTRTARGGRFRVSYQPQALGVADLRVRFAGSASLAASTVRVRPVESFRVAVASWYGGYGSTACGERLTPTTLGVANKTLPCGTMVTLRYGGRTVTVPVIDRGPFVPGREFDLTEGTRNVLGFEGVGAVWSSR